MIALLFTFRPALALSSAFVLMIGLFIAVQANASTLAQSQAKLDALYEQLLSDPSNVDVTLEYTELAVEIGDYEAAIPPLERLLITNPSANKLKLELGMMYYLLGSYDVARTYFTEITADANAKPAYRSQAENYLKRM